LGNRARPGAVAAELVRERRAQNGLLAASSELTCRPMWRVCLIFIALFYSAGLAAAADWTLAKIGGRDHVTLRNVAEFYGLGGVQRVKNEFSLRSVGRQLRGQANSAEFYINNLKFILSYPVTEHDGQLWISRMDLTKLLEPVLRPSRIKHAETVDTVVLDAGHGGHDNGAYSPQGWEKQFTLDVAMRCRALLSQSGINVVMTRSTDTFVPLEERTRIANRHDNALFISIHFNSGGAGTGLETYTLAPRGVPSMMADGPRISDLEPCPGNVRDAENIALATATHAAFVVNSRMYDRGIKRARFVVIRDVTIPGVLVEGGFLSNAYDARLIASPEYRQRMAASIYQAVMTYRRVLAPEVSVASAQSLEQREVARRSQEALRGGEPAPAAEPKR
jgi:N-acetylmuramoyl-L-alanine amidase